MLRIPGDLELEQSRTFVVMTTAPAGAAAAGIARALVESRLAACVQVVPGATSFYHWQGKLEESAEAVLFIKTTAARLDELVAKVQSLHPYDLPEVVAMEVAGGAQDYLQWVRQETRE